MIISEPEYMVGEAGGWTDGSNDGLGGVIGAGGVLGLSPVSSGDEAGLVGNWGDKD